jgi:hypothetical protein
MEPQRREGRKGAAKFIALIDLAKGGLNDVRLAWNELRFLKGVLKHKGHQEHKDPSQRSRRHRI